MPRNLIPYVTLDVDFLGTSTQAREFADQIRGAKLYVPTLDDHTPSSGRVIARNVLGRTLEVDFLHSLAGLSETDVRRNAVDLKNDKGNVIVRVMHPYYCLESRVKNLILLPNKRDQFGIAQASLAVQVLRRHISQVLRDEHGTRKALRLVERVGDMAMSEPGKRCFIEYRIDVIKAIPHAAIPVAAFQERRWPQIKRMVAERRNQLRTLIRRASSPSARGKRKRAL